MKTLIYFLLSIIIPVIAFIRGSVIATQYFQLPPSVSLIAGTGVAVLSSSILGYWFSKKLKKGRETSKVIRKLVLLGLAGYIAFGFIYLNQTHMKSSGLEEHYQRLHPVLRVGVVCATVFDRRLLITDITREPVDYAKMNIDINSNSLHYPQPGTGFVHAVDLRTIQKAEVMNVITEWYFILAGFSTKRHADNATNDHLHIQLNPRARSLSDLAKSSAHSTSLGRFHALFR